MIWESGDVRVFTVAGVHLRVGGETWAFAEENAEAIQAHWTQRLASTPNFFNGIVHLLQSYAVGTDGVLSGRFVRTDFASFLYWRETGWPDRSVMDAFGSALISVDGGRVLFGRQRGGNLNSGLCYPPSGFIDPADVRPDGTIDIEGGVLREVREETGLDLQDLRRIGGLVVTAAGPVLSISVPLRSMLSAEDLIDRCTRHIAADSASELASVLLLAPGAADPALHLPEYASALLKALPGLKSPT